MSAGVSRIEDRMVEGAVLGQCQRLCNLRLNLTNNAIQATHTQNPGNRVFDRFVGFTRKCGNIDRVGVGVHTGGRELSNSTSRGLEGAHLRFCCRALSEDRTKLIGVSEKHRADCCGNQQNSREFH